MSRRRRPVGGRWGRGAPQCTDPPERWIRARCRAGAWGERSLWLGSRAGPGTGGGADTPGALLSAVRERQVQRCAGSNPGGIRANENGSNRRFSAHRLTMEGALKGWKCRFTNGWIGALPRTRTCGQALCGLSYVAAMVTRPHVGPVPICCGPRQPFEPVRRPASLVSLLFGPRAAVAVAALLRVHRHEGQGRALDQDTAFRIVACWGCNTGGNGRDQRFLSSSAAKNTP
jgi:hypothetical protein